MCFPDIFYRPNLRVRRLVFLAAINKANPALRARSDTRRCVAAESEIPTPVQIAMYAARHIGHFGNIARIAPGMIQPKTSTHRRANVRGLEFSQQRSVFIDTLRGC